MMKMGMRFNGLGYQGREADNEGRFSGKWVDIYIENSVGINVTMIAKALIYQVK